WLLVSFRRMVLGIAPVGGDTVAHRRISGRNDHIVFARVPALRVPVRDREHAPGHSGADLPDSCALRCHRFEGDFPEGCRIECALGRVYVSGSLCSRCFSSNDAEDASESRVTMLMRTYQILLKELRQMLRARHMRVLLVAPPLVQLLLFGYAVNLDVDKVSIAWMDRDQTDESRDILAAFQGSLRFEVVAFVDSEEQVQQLLDSGRVQGVMRILPGFARDIQRGQTASIQVLIEGTNSNTAEIVKNYASTLIDDYSRAVKAKRSGDEQRPGLQARSRVWFNPELH